MHTLSFLKKSTRCFLILSTALLTWSSCKQGSAPGTSAFEPVTDSVKNAFLSNLKGVWVAKKYIETLDSTKSPYDAFKQLKGHAVLVIPGAAASDSLTISTSYKNHTDSSIVLQFKKTAGKGLLLSIPDTAKNTYYSLGYLNSGSDTTACIYHYSGNQVLLDSTLFVKVANHIPENKKADWAIDYVVMKSLFAGEYWIHGIKERKIVNITTDGKISGLDEFKTYKVRTDFTGAFGDKDWIQLDTIPRENIFKMMIDADSIKMVSIGLRIMLVKLH